MPVTKNPGETVTVNVVVENTGNVSMDLVTSANVVGLVDLGSQSFTLGAFQQTTLTFQGTIPSNASPGDYDVYVELRDSAGNLLDSVTLPGEVTIPAITGARIVSVTVS